MIHAIEMTREEKIAMYMKLSKRELAEMLANSNVLVDSLLKRIPERTQEYTPPLGTWSPTPESPWTIVHHP